MGKTMNGILSLVLSIVTLPAWAHSTASPAGMPSVASSHSNPPQVATKHSFTGRMCAASRDQETRRPDSLFTDPLGGRLAGAEGMAAPMGSWILVPRTRHGDDHLVRRYNDHGVRQLVLLGAGMDSRAYRTFASSARSSPEESTTLSQLKVFEIDQPTTFDVKEPLLEAEQLTVASRIVIGHDFAKDKSDGWAAALEAHGYDVDVPTCWLLEGLLYYLSELDVAALMKQIGALSAAGSSVFHDAVSANYVRAGIAPGGAPFISGSDSYAELWHRHGGFNQTIVYDFKTLHVDRRERRIVSERASEVSPSGCAGRDLVLFVEAFKAVESCIE